LLDLGALQAVLRSGQFDVDALWFATSGARKDREKYQWSNADVLEMLLALRGPAHSPSDYFKSEWCEVDDVNGMRWVPCDAYRMNYDIEGRRRDAHGTEMYLKFSLEDGVLAIVLASCHPSR